MVNVRADGVGSMLPARSIARTRNGVVAVGEAGVGLRRGARGEGCGVHPALEVGARLRGGEPESEDAKRAPVAPVRNGLCDARSRRLRAASAPRRATAASSATGSRSG